jgi:hypothetical protein
VVQYREIELDRLFIDRNYQRPAVKSLQQRIIENFDERALGALEVSERTNGKSASKFAVMDGQQRWGALRQIDPTRRVRCLVHSNLSVQEEAEVFGLINNGRRLLNPVERFQAAVTARNKKALAIKKVVEKHGWKIEDTSGHASRVKAVTVLYRLYDLGDLELVDQTIGLAEEIWHGDVRVTHGEFLAGLGMFVHQYGSKLTTIHKTRLAVHSPTAYLRRAEVTFAGGGGVKRGVVEELRKTSKLKKEA